MALIGRLHPLLIHFPIALVIVAAAAESASVMTADARWRFLAIANLRTAAVPRPCCRRRRVAARRSRRDRRECAPRVASLGRIRGNSSDRRGGRDHVAGTYASARRGSHLSIRIVRSGRSGRGCRAPRRVAGVGRQLFPPVRRHVVSGNNDERELDRRHFLQCMAWVGTGAAWAMSGGSPARGAARPGTPDGDDGA